MARQLEAQVDRIRAALPPAPTTREVPMFGGVSFMVDDRLVVAAGRDGDLLVRADPTRASELLRRPGAAPAEMGAGRPMGPGWIRVAPDAIDADEQLASWVELALAHRRDVAGGPAGRAASAAAGRRP